MAASTNHAEPAKRLSEQWGDRLVSLYRYKEYWTEENIINSLLPVDVAAWQNHITQSTKTTLRHSEKLLAASVLTQKSSTISLSYNLEDVLSPHQSLLWRIGTIYWLSLSLASFQPLWRLRLVFCANFIVQTNCEQNRQLLTWNYLLLRVSYLEG